MGKEYLVECFNEVNGARYSTLEELRSYEGSNDILMLI